ncbi:MoaD/ThiS family protein [Sanyastnella coralliicola]|uniref:MoaD/ThiS family protein n=1 Tax=Sanyastnella coralliicola TaxID=3069118 RepID=UPI0027BA3D2A|nr:MoaD/ThiS family protein [Longitalea sp. SCSIO 12813]
MARLIIPTPLRKFTADQAEFESTGNNVKEVINQLIDEYNGLKQHLLDERGDIRSFVRIYVGDEDIQALNREHTTVEANSVVSIIPAIAGGSH